MGEKICYNLGEPYEGLGRHSCELVQPQIGRRQWSWQLRWRAFGCAERCCSSQQHRSSLGAALDVFVCLSVLVDVVVVVELRRWLPMVNLYL